MYYRLYSIYAIYPYSRLLSNPWVKYTYFGLNGNMIGSRAQKKVKEYATKQPISHQALGKDSFGFGVLDVRLAHRT